MKKKTKATPSRFSNKLRLSASKAFAELMDAAQKHHQAPVDLSNGVAIKIITDGKEETE